MLEGKKYFLFDMDGLLIDSEYLHLYYWGKIFERNHIDRGLEIMKKMIGTSGKEAQKILLEETGNLDFFKPYQVEKDEAFYGHLEREGMPVKPYARELLTYLKENHYPMYLVSSTPKERVEKFLTYAKLNDFFEYRVTGDMAENSKPSPELYLLTCDKYQLEKEKCIVFEDSKNGIIASDLAGLDVIAIPDISDISDVDVEHLIGKVPSLKVVLDELKGQNEKL